MEPIRFQIAKDIAHTSLDDGEGVLLDLKSGHYFSLNETGELLWKCIEQGKAVPAMSDALMDEYAVTREDAEKHIHSFTDELVALKMLHRENNDKES